MRGLVVGIVGQVEVGELMVESVFNIGECVVIFDNV